MEKEKNIINQKCKGNVIEYDFSGHLIFERAFLNSNKNGKGKEYFSKFFVYEGAYLNGERKVKGKEYLYKK